MYARDTLFSAAGRARGVQPHGLATRGIGGPEAADPQDLLWPGHR